MTTATQDPKFNIVDGRLANAGTGKLIPIDEPVFIIRGQDRHAVDALHAYLALCSDREHRRAISIRIKQFEAFALTNAVTMKEPDTDLGRNGG